MTVSERIARLLVFAVGALSVAAVARLRDPARVEAPPLSPRQQQASPSRAGGSAANSEPKSAGVAVRLIERLASAVVNAPELERVDKELAYWRRMRSPYFGASGQPAELVQQVSLVRPGSMKRKGRKREAGTWVLDPKMWNMNEGSFDQREAILAPPPATLRFRSIVIPDGAVFEAAPAIAGPGYGGVEFEVAVRDRSGARHVLGTRSVEGGRTGAFADWQIPLAEFAGQTVELELSTRAKIKGVGPAAALFGTPVVYAPSKSALPFNVLFIVVDAMRGDALAATHDDATDAAVARAEPPAFEAWLPRLPEVAPNLDQLAKAGVIFTKAYSGGTWTRPGTLAMLAGAHSSALGLSALPLVPAAPDVLALYARRPGFLPLLFRAEGAVTRAVVNNFYMVGYAGVGVDMGFEGLVDHRFQREDTANIVADSVRLLEQNRGRRFFFFVNFNSPHSPYQPPPSARAAIPRAPRGPGERMVRDYLAEIHKDDAAIGELLAKLDGLGLRDQTLVVVTADHGETLSREHETVPVGVDGGPRIGGRFHHLSSLYDETARVPLIVSWPKRLPAGRRVDDPVSSIDILPTLVELAGLDLPAHVRGSSLVPLIDGKSEPERAIVVEGRGAHAIRVGRWRLVVRDDAYQHVWVKGRRVKRKVELYDLEADPGERVQVAAQHPEVVSRLLAADQRRGAERVVGQSGSRSPKYHLRFSGGAQLHRLKGELRGRTADGGAAKLSAVAVGLPEGALSRVGEGVLLDVALTPGAFLGFDLGVEPPNADLSWSFFLDGAPWPGDAAYAGEFALSAATLATGVRGEAGRRELSGTRLPWVDASETGLFVVRDADAGELRFAETGAAKAEAMGLMKAWGYVR
ncbi:MAG: sulfatase [Myxococcales bacterium]|nr:sulfatase [Myxococcales bacterium]